MPDRASIVTGIPDLAQARALLGAGRVAEAEPLCHAVLARNIGDAGACQALLGVSSVALVYLLAARLFGPAVAAIAGFGAALYGPLLLHEPFLIRDSLAVTTSLQSTSRCT